MPRLNAQQTREKLKRKMEEANLPIPQSFIKAEEQFKSQNPNSTEEQFWFKAWCFWMHEDFDKKGYEDETLESRMARAMICLHPIPADFICHMFDFFKIENPIH